MLSLMHSRRSNGYTGLAPQTGKHVKMIETIFTLPGCELVKRFLI